MLKRVSGLIVCAILLSNACILSYAKGTIDHLTKDPYEVIIEQAEKLRETKDVTEKGLNDFVLKELDKLPKSAVSTREYTDYLPIDENLLGPTEKAIFNEHPLKGLNALMAGKNAIKYSKKYFTDDFDYHNDNADAFRHTYWNLELSARCGKDFAKEWTDAHETDFPNPQLESIMDDWNNIMGRVLYSEMGLYDTFIAVTKEAVFSGRCRRFYGNDIGYSDKLHPTNNDGAK